MTSEGDTRDLDLALIEIEDHLSNHVQTQFAGTGVNLLGTQEVGRRIFPLLVSAGISVVSIFDSDEKKQGQVFFDRTIEKPWDNGFLTIICAYNSTSDTFKLGFRELITWQHFILQFQIAGALPWNCLSLDYKHFKSSVELYRDVYLRCIDRASQIEFLKQLKSRFFLSQESLLSLEDEYLSVPYLDVNKVETIFDCGAYDGDTAELFISYFGDRGVKPKIVCIEPDQVNFGSLCSRFSSNPNVIPVNALLSSLNGAVSYSSTGTVTSGLKSSFEQGERIGVVSRIKLDDLFEIFPCQFIKMDIEGGEAEALSGADRVINSMKVTFALSAYHLVEDIPRLTSFFPIGYRFAFSAHAQRPWDSCLYAIPSP